MSRRRLGLVLLVVLAAAATTGIAVAGKGNGNNKTFEFTVGLWGDMPYSDVQAQTGVPNLIDDMNNSDISFSIHDGDLKAGSGAPGSVTPTTCSDAALPAGARVPQLTPAAGVLHARRQRLDRLRPSGKRLVQ
jgi:hypothetical protein